MLDKDILLFFLYLSVVPLVFIIPLIVFYKIISLFQTPDFWRKEAEQLDPETFLTGQVFTQFEIIATPPEERPINEKREIRGFDTDYIYLFKWIKDNELIFIRKYSAKSIWDDFLNSLGNSNFPELRTKNHVRFDNNKAFVTGLYLKGGLAAQWFFVLLIPLVAILGLLNDFSLFQIAITIFFAIPMSKLFYDAVTKLPRIHIKRGLELITTKS